MAGIGNWSLDPQIGVPNWSEEVYRIYERDPSLGPYALADYPKIYQGKWWEKFNTAIQEAIQRGIPYDIELKLILPSGNIKWVNAICAPDEKIRPNGYFLRGTIQDITERKKLELKYKTQTENLKAIFDRAPFILSICDEDLCVKMINRKGAGFVKKDKEELSGRLCGEVFQCQHSFAGNGCGNNSECCECSIRSKVLSTFKSGKPHYEEDGKMNLIIDGEEKILTFSISTEILKFNNYERVLLSMVDITKRKENESKLIEQKKGNRINIPLSTSRDWGCF